MKTAIYAVVAIAVLGGGYYLLKPDNTLVTDNNTDTTEESTETGDKKMAFSQFVSQGGSYKCDVNQSVQGTDTMGTVYINNGMIRGEFSTQAQGISVDSTLVVKDGYTYTWTSMQPNMGFKVAVSNSATSDGGTSTSGQYAFNADNIGDYNCEAWTADSSKFVIPSTIVFTELK